MEFLAPGFGLPQPWLLWPWESEPKDISYLLLFVSVLGVPSVVGMLHAFTAGWFCGSTLKLTKLII